MLGKQINEVRGYPQFLSEDDDYNAPMRMETVWVVERRVSFRDMLYDGVLYCVG